MGNIQICKCYSQEQTPNAEIYTEHSQPKVHKKQQNSTFTVDSAILAGDQKIQNSQNSLTDQNDFDSSPLKIQSCNLKNLKIFKNYFKTFSSM
jgi:hypothetical protein